MKLRIIFFVGILEIFSANAFCQSSEWKMVDGHAIAQKSVTVPGKSSSDIYKEIYRWLMKRYKDPEDILKAKLEGEYLRGVGYHSNFLSGARGNAGLQYTFTFKIEDERVDFKIVDAIVVFSNSQDDDREYPIEDYIDKQLRKGGHSEILSATNEFSDALFESFEYTLAVELR